MMSTGGCPDLVGAGPAREHAAGAPEVGAAPNADKYELIVYWSEEDQTFVVEVPALPGCVADGSSDQEAVANDQRVIEDWIDTAQRVRRPIPEPKGRLMDA